MKLTNLLSDLLTEATVNKVELEFGDDFKATLDFYYAKVNGEFVLEVWKHLEEIPNVEGLTLTEGARKFTKDKLGEVEKLGQIEFQFTYHGLRSTGEFSADGEYFEYRAYNKKKLLLNGSVDNMKELREMMEIGIKSLWKEDREALLDI